MLLTTSIPGRKHHFWGAKSCSTFSPGLEVPAAAPAAAAAAPAAAPDGPTPEKTPENRVSFRFPRCASGKIGCSRDVEKNVIFT